MKIRLDVSPETEITVVKDEHNNVLAVELSPMFTGKNSNAVLAYGKSTSQQDKVLERFSLTVSGKSGLVTKRTRSEAVKAAIDRPEGEAGEPEEESNE